MSCAKKSFEQMQIRSRDAAAQGRLGDMQLFGSARDAPAPGDSKQSL